MNTDRLEHDSLVTRVAKVERQNRRMRIALTCLLLAGSGAVIMGSKAPSESKTVEANLIVVRDSHGNKRVVIGVDKTHKSADPRSGVFVYDEYGEECVLLSASKGKAGLGIEEEGKPRVVLSTGKKEFAGLMINAEAGKSKNGQIGLFYADDGAPACYFNDSNGQTRIMMILDQKRNEKPVFALQDANQKSFFAKAQP